MRVIIILLFLIGFVNRAAAQKLAFQNFSVDKGLIQSQVLCMTQDQQHHLWLGTFGGFDRFDGSSFKHFAKSEGLNSSAVTCIYTSKNGTIWAGTFKGIVSYDGFKVSNYPIQNKSSSFNFSAIAEDQSGAIWAFNFREGLYVFKNSQFVKATLPFAGAIPTCLYNNYKGQLLVSFLKKGVYLFTNNAWRQFEQMPPQDSTTVIAAINDFEDSYFAITNRGRLIEYAGNKVIAEKQLVANAITASCVDGKGDLWIGTNKGVQVYSKKDMSVTHVYTAVSGLSDNVINCLYKDLEDNMWIGTDGDGLFKFSGGSFARLDNTNGLPGKIVMGIIKDGSGDLFIGTRERGLVKYIISDKTITPVDYLAFSKAGINAMAADPTHNLLLGTMDARLLRYDGRKFTEVFLDKKLNPFINTIIPDGDKTWFTTTFGCYYLRGDSATKIKGIDEIAVGVLRVADDEVLVGSTNGLYSVNGTNHAIRISDPVLHDMEVRCLTKFKEFILIGTAGDGIYFWNRQPGKIYHCDTRNGLFDNQVFGLFIDSHNIIWAGTSTGIQQIAFNEKQGSFTVKKFSSSDGYENSENNLNAITEDKFGAIWFGTTNGAFIYNRDTSITHRVAPYVVIQNTESRAFIKDSSGNSKMSPWYHFPVSPVLPYNNSNISFSVKGILLTDPGSVSYSYQLVGYDERFSMPAQQSFFNYQSLEPGNYVFKVKAITANGIESSNFAEYPFSVATPFYKSKWFLFLVTLALILTGVLIQLLINRARQKKRSQLEALRQDEQQKIRQRTSEDFHDELGNKLTRISLLADILQKKTGQPETERNKIIDQIKDNVQALYAGTKDVIWSLSPDSDNFSEVINRIRQFGEQLFDDTEISFSFTGSENIGADLKLPTDYSRNIIMIFKELLNNSLRHANATTIIMTVQETGINQYSISQTDDGAGYDEHVIKKGNGLNNIERRAKRIGAVLVTTSHKAGGTRTTLRIKIPSTGG